jgi:Mor family transcriptional regulator
MKSPLIEDLSNLPEDLLPEIKDLPGDLAHLATVIESVAPGLGVRLVLRLVAEYRGTGIYFHNTDWLKRRIRDAWIIERYNRGERVVEIARDPMIGLSDRQVWTIIGRSPDEDKQMKLF